MTDIDHVAGTIVVTNSQPANVLLRLEPWADERIMIPDSSVEIAFSGPSDGRIVVEVKPGEVVVYGWQGAVMSIANQ